MSNICLSDILITVSPSREMCVGVPKKCQNITQQNASDYQAI